MGAVAASVGFAGWAKAAMFDHALLGSEIKKIGSDIQLPDFFVKETHLFHHCAYLATHIRRIGSKKRRYVGMTGKARIASDVEKCLLALIHRHAYYDVGIESRHPLVFSYAARLLRQHRQECAQFGFIICSVEIGV